MALLHGQRRSDLSPVYNTRGSSAPSTSVGSRYRQCAAMDRSTGLTYLYGGYQSGARGDLFSYSPDLNQFAWISGTSFKNNEPAYGVSGTFYPSTSTSGQPGAGPGGRDLATCWVWESVVYVFGGRYDDASSNDKSARRPLGIPHPFGRVGLHARVQPHQPFGARGRCGLQR